MIRIERNQQANCLLACGMCAQSSLFRVLRKGGRVPFEIDNVIRTKYTHVLNEMLIASTFVYERLDIYEPFTYHPREYIRCTTLLPPFFFRNSRLYCKKLVIHLWFKVLSIATFSHLSGSVRIPRRKNWSSFEAIHESIQFFTSS